jgi:hypothetical protein
MLFSDIGLEAVDVGAGEESGLPLFVVAPTSEDSMAIVAGDGFSQMSAPGSLVPFAEEFFGFLPAGSLSKDWEDFYSLPTDREGMSDSELLEEAFALPWEVDVLASSSCREKEVSSSGVEINQVVQPSALAKSLIWCGFLGLRAISPSLVVLKEIMPMLKGKESTVPVILPSLLEDKQGVQPPVAAVLPSSQVCSSSIGISLSQLWYTRRVKEKVAK